MCGLLQKEHFACNRDREDVFNIICESAQKENNNNNNNKSIVTEAQNMQ
jgi:hypothetical protein